MQNQTKHLLRRASTLDAFLWGTLLDTLCSNADLARLARHHLQAVKNAPLPTDRANRVAALIPAAGEHPYMAHLVDDLARISPPEPAPNTPDEARDAVLTAPDPRAFGLALWRGLAASHDGVAGAAIAAAQSVLHDHSPDEITSGPALGIADEIVEAILDELRPALEALSKIQQSAEVATRAAQTVRTAVEKADRQLRETLGQFRSDLTRLTAVSRSLEDRLAALSQAPSAPRIDPAALAESVAARLVASPPRWWRDSADRISMLERIVSTLPGMTVDMNHVRAIRQAWRAAHADAPVRIGLFADVANLYFGARDWHEKRVDFTALRNRLGVEGEVTCALAFVVQLTNMDQSGFLNALRRAQWEPRLRVPKKFGDHLKANWDVGLTLEVVSLAGQLDIVGLATGDGDFVDLLGWLRSCGVQTRVAAIPESAAADLRAAADEFITIDESLLRPIPSREPQPDLVTLEGS